MGGYGGACRSSLGMGMLRDDTFSSLCFLPGERPFVSQQCSEYLRVGWACVGVGHVHGRLRIPVAVDNGDETKEVGRLLEW